VVYDVVAAAVAVESFLDGSPGKSPLTRIARSVHIMINSISLTSLLSRRRPRHGVYLHARIAFLSIRLSKVHSGILKQGQVQHIQPNNWLITLISVIMPVPRRCEDDVAALEGHLLPLHGSGALAVDDEAARVGDVSMGRGYLAGVDDLQAGVYGVSGMGRSCMQIRLR
jgi:hypothetical protein